MAEFFIVGRVVQKFDEGDTVGEGKTLQSKPII